MHAYSRILWLLVQMHQLSTKENLKFSSFPIKHQSHKIKGTDKSTNSVLWVSSFAFSFVRDPGDGQTHKHSPL